MKYHFFLNIFNLIIINIIIKLSFSSIPDSSIFPVKKIILTDDLNRMLLSNNIRLDIEPLGYGITFNNNSNISLIPYNLFTRIRIFYEGFEDILSLVKTSEDGNKEIILYANIDYGFETFHFILENFGITIPLKYYLVEKDETQKYGIRFLTNENQEYISFGKDLIEVMDIEFIDKNNFIIHNDEFISKLND